MRIFQVVSQSCGASKHPTKNEQNECVVVSGIYVVHNLSHKKNIGNEEGNKFLKLQQTVIFSFVLLNHESRTNKFRNFEPKDRRSLLRAAQLPVSLYN